ncbi:DNA-binding protein [Glutamicibacter soli]|uniref:Single-stranded DNA-binding protein n=1 Tax=Glutamicibacter soli TaxID=453836 RepID=A0A6L9GA04_9MICC|nr:single-stranded DNA-binding protein [Glutamicibacter soli]NAZ17939.1 DNA-binding protein [Glutamicibacter soli]
MAIVVEIENAQILTRSGVSERTGKPYTIREQQALMFREGERYPERIKVTLDEGMSAYQPGRYTLSDASFSVSRFGAMQVRPLLLRIASEKAA